MRQDTTHPTPFKNAPIITAILLGILFICANLCGCSPKGYVKASAIEGAFQKVKDRHDNYVDNDQTLTPLQKRIYKRSSALVDKVLKEAVEKSEDLQPDDESTAFHDVARAARYAALEHREYCNVPYHRVE